MKKIFLILIVILFSSSAFADHDKYKCTKNKSILYGADKVLKEELMLEEIMVMNICLNL